MPEINAELDSKLNELFSDYNPIIKGYFKEAIYQLADTDKVKNPISRLEFMAKIKQGKLWVDKSSESLEDSNILFEKKRYSAAVRCLNHSVELLCKAHGMIYFNFPIKQLKAFSHRTPKLFFAAAKTPDSKIMIDLINKVNQTNIGDVESAEKNAMEIERSKLVAIGSENDIQGVLTTANAVKENIINENKKIVDFILKLPIVFSKEMDEITKEKLQIFSTDFNPEYFGSSPRLFLVSLITYPHKYFTEYPNVDVTYDENLGIIKARKPIIKIVEEEIKLAYELVELFEKINKKYNSNDSPASMTSTSTVPLP